MAFGDELKAGLNELLDYDTNKLSANAWWTKLRDLARKDILAMFPHKVDSDLAVAIYYEILSDNLEYVPFEYQQKLPSNNQERFRVINRNMWTSNAFHPDGLANQEGIIAEKEINYNRKGERIVYQGDPEYVNKKRIR